MIETEEVIGDSHIIELLAIDEQRARCLKAIARVRDAIVASRDLVERELERATFYTYMFSDLANIMKMPYLGSSADEMEGTLNALNAHYNLRRESWEMKYNG